MAVTACRAPPAQVRATRRAAPRLQGVLSFASAGNDGTSFVYYPAGYDKVISVNAVDRDNKKAWFGMSNDAIDLTAPGEEMLMAKPGANVWDPALNITVSALPGGPVLAFADSVHSWMTDGDGVSVAPPPGAAQRGPRGARL
jgi:hypothetical protein